MREYAVGAFEALSWVRSMIKNSNSRCQVCQRVLEEIDEVLENMQAGIAVDFRRRVGVIC